MSNIKKIIGVVLALVMVLSVATVAFAADGDAYSVAFTADKTTLNAGESATVTVKITSNFNVSAMSIPVFFDNSKVTVTAATTLPADKTEIATEADPDVDKYFQGSGHTKDNYGIRALVYVAKQGDSIRSYSDEAVMTLTVTAKDGASGAVVLECISTTVKTSTNPSGTLYLAKNSSGHDTVDSLGEVIDNATVTGAKTTITIAGGMEPADLALTAAGTTDGVIIDTRVTFGGQYAGVVYGFNQKTNTTFRANTTYLTAALQATNEGTLEFSRGIGTAGWGTGTEITVKNSDGTVAKTYVVVIFGDVNCDGMINVVDTNTVKGYVSKPATLTNKVVRLAANCQKNANSTIMYNVNVGDTNAVKAYVSGSAAKVTQAAYAANFSTVTVHNNYK